MKPLSIRWRLTLWYGGSLAIILMAFSALVYLMMRHLTMADTSLVEQLAELEKEVASAASMPAMIERCDQYFGHREGNQFQLSTLAGEVLFRSGRLEDQQLPMPRFHRRSRDAVASSEWLPVLGHYRIVSREVLGPDGPLVAQTALSLASYDKQLQRLELAMMIAIPLALTCALAGGYLMARKALAPVDAMAATASKITAVDLNRRLPRGNSADEFGRLAAALNGMIERLERSFEEVRRFTADAAHELRTPLAIMRSEAEISLRSPRPPEEYRRVIESMLEETTHLSRLSEQLLFLCREDAGLISVSFERVSLCEVLEDLCEQLHIAVTENGVSIVTEIDRDCFVSGDPQRLRRLFLNLLDNAIKYTPVGGSIHVRCNSTHEAVAVTIEDTGRGIPAEYVPHIFDRFYRVDVSRNPGIKGTGLGLAISRSIVEAHHGAISVASRVGYGSQFKVVLKRDAGELGSVGRAVPGAVAAITDPRPTTSAPV